MIKKNSLKIIISTIITLLPILFGFIFWDRLPERIATSFGWNGEVTGYSSKWFAIAGLPVILAFVNLLCIIATSADPKRKNIDNKTVSVVMGVVPACSIAVSACIYGNALGYEIKADSIMPIFVGIVILVLGFLLSDCKQNYTIGIKLPWTLNDEENWNKTHKFAGKLWIAGGIMMTVSGFLSLKILFLIIMFAIVIIPTVYSWLLYRNKKQ